MLGCQSCPTPTRTPIDLHTTWQQRQLRSERPQGSGLTGRLGAAAGGTSQRRAATVSESSRVLAGSWVRVQCSALRCSVQGGKPRKVGSPARLQSFAALWPAARHQHRDVVAVEQDLIKVRDLQWITVLAGSSGQETTALRQAAESAVYSISTPQVSWLVAVQGPAAGRLAQTNCAAGTRCAAASTTALRLLDCCCCSQTQQCSEAPAAAAKPHIHKPGRAAGRKTKQQHPPSCPPA